MRVVRVLLRERRREKVAQLLDTRTAIISEQGYIKRNENINCHVLDSFVNFFFSHVGIYRFEIEDVYEYFIILRRQNYSSKSDIY